MTDFEAGTGDHGATQNKTPTEIEGAKGNGEPGPIDITKGRRKRQGGKIIEGAPVAFDPKKLTKSELQAIYVNAMNGFTLGFPPFPERFEVFVDDDAIKTVAFVDNDDVIHDRTEKALQDAIGSYNLNHVLPKYPDAARLTQGAIREIAAQFMNSRKPLRYRDVALVKQKSEKGLCWQRLDFDLAPGETPTFDELFSRFDSNADSVMAWIGSLLDPKSSRQQYVWLHGDGGNGKGALIRFLMKAFGPSAKSAYVNRQRPPNQFWSRFLVGKRFVALPDCSYFDFVTSDYFKLLTGGDLVETEIKGGACQSAEMICKFLFASQEKPAISGSNADMRRAMYASIAPITCAPIAAHIYDAMLWQEAPHFLWKCQEAFKPHAVKGEIPVDLEKRERLIEANEEKWYVMLENLFDVGPRLELSAQDFRNVLSKIEKLNDLDVGKFKSFLSRTCGVNRVRRTRDGKTQWTYVGIALNEVTRRQLKAEAETAF